MAALHRLRKDELIWRATHRCAHHHTYLDHPECYRRDHPDQERVGFLDIETTGLDAGFGIVLCWAIKLAGQADILHDVITLRDIQRGKAGDEDERIVRSCIKALGGLGRVITHYGGNFRFDLPFLRTRAVALKLPFPTYGMIKQEDTYAILRAKFKLPRNRLETACRVLFGETEKTHLDPVVWRRAGRGDKQALAYVLKHNLADVRDLERVYNAITSSTRGFGVSI